MEILFDGKKSEGNKSAKFDPTVNKKLTGHCETGFELPSVTHPHLSSMLIFRPSIICSSG